MDCLWREALRRNGLAKYLVEVECGSFMQQDEKKFLV
jgi:hypothetical protein